MTKGKPFLLGFFSVAGQVLLLRELVSSFNGDELFIGLALFGWLLAVTLGSYLGGRDTHQPGAVALFIAGCAVLCVLIPAVRLLPLFVSEVAGQVIPFATAGAMAILVMLPPGLISGWLFSVIAKEGWGSEGAVVTVYLWEGAGAFVGGVLIAMFSRGVLSNMALALAVVVVAVGFLTLNHRERSLAATALFTLITTGLLFGSVWIAGRIDSALDGIKYQPYHVVQSFDTPYGRQTVLSRDNMIVLLTDNKVEAVHPDVRTAENLLLPAMLYQPMAREILYFGRSEFGLAQLTLRLEPLHLTAVDPRRSLNGPAENATSFGGGVTRLTDDPLSFINERAGRERFDVIIIDAGEPDNYQTNRLLTPEFFRQTQRLLTESGLLVIPTAYDTDRYVSDDVAALLSIIRNSLAASFDQVVVWPGGETLLMASNASLFGVSTDSLVVRMNRLEYDPTFLSESFLRDRLNEFKRERLTSALSSDSDVNSAARPVLPHRQALYRSTGDRDRLILSFWLEQPYGYTLGLVPIFGLLTYASVGRDRRRRFGLFMYLVAGLISISLELLSFYVFQTTAGSLYSELAALVGSFMLGLAVGTYYAQQLKSRHLEYPALVVLILAGAIFGLTWNRIEPSTAIGYHLLFLFVMALATGSLFVAATRRYYENRPLRNRGIGYAVEVLGSAIGALLTLTLLLPMLGVTGLLVTLELILAVALVGAIITARSY
ncbi:MAG: hypothetical protein OEV49_09525 [candidate division Zixibacteria bacterium]|nr:hypothetical protein [candidate division Zixibacteria bacterium]MDH3937382.1 hypothetical protein [candidate division Zixibacteria bacterium]MDH4033246.1 hypothetical protein [candidate division Zixibacteria bacterium]